MGVALFQSHHCGSGDFSHTFVWKEVTEEYKQEVSSPSFLISELIFIFDNLNDNVEF